MGENGKKILLIVIIIAALAVIGMTAMSVKKQAEFTNSQLPNKVPEWFGKGAAAPPTTAPGAPTALMPGGAPAAGTPGGAPPAAPPGGGTR